MDLSIVSYNGHLINDGTNYNAYFPEGSYMLQGSVEVNDVARPDVFPAYAGKIFKSGTLSIEIAMLGTITSQIDTLKGWLDVHDLTLHELLVKDIANSNKQWYLNCTVLSQPDVEGNVATFTFSIQDPIWQAKTQGTDAWNITASGQTKEITIAGNQDAYPVFEITPTSAGGNGFSYGKWIMLRNRSTHALSNYATNIVDTVLDTAALVADITRHVHINQGGGIGANDTTIPYDGEVGTFPALGRAYLGTEQISYTSKSGGNLTGVIRGINGTTKAAHLDDVEIDASLVAADGRDMRVFIDGIETPRWFQDFNTANTKIWIVASWKVPITLTVQDIPITDPLPIRSGDPSGHIDFVNNDANVAAVGKLKTDAGSTFILYCDDEAFQCNTPNTDRNIVFVSERAAKGTAANTHAVDTEIYWIEHEIWLYYGNQNMGLPVYDESRKPIFELTSTNISWIYAAFSDLTGLRSGSWSPSLNSTSNKIDQIYKSLYYTGARLLLADPATQMGMSIQSFRSGSVWKAENASIQWLLYHPCGITAVTVTGEAYRTTVTWPSAKLQKSNNGSDWTDVWTDASPASVSSWTALSAHSTVSCIGFYIRALFTGTQPGTSGAQANYSYTDVTVALDSSTVPLIVVGAQQALYHLQATITNNETGEWIKLDVKTALNATILLDTESRQVTLPDGSNGLPGLSWSSVRPYWFRLLPASVNTIQFDDADTVAVTMITKWRDRNS